MQYFSLQHQTLLSPPDTSTRGHHIHFGSTSSFFLDLFLHSFPVAYWRPPELGGLSFSVIYFYLFILFMVFPRQECWSDLSFPSQVNHVLSEVSNHDLSKLGGPAWHGLQFHWVTQSCDQSNVILVSFLWLCFPYCLPSGWMRVRGLCQLPYGRDWLWGKLGSCSGGQSCDKKSLIWFSAYEWGWLPPCSLAWSSQVLESCILHGSAIVFVGLMATFSKKTCANTLAVLDQCSW